MEVATPQLGFTNLQIELLKLFARQITHDDNKFVDCALFSGTGYIVTHDRHFNVLKNLGFPTIKVLTAEAFRDVFDKTYN